MSRFTGYRPEAELRDELLAAALDYDFEQFVCRGDLPATRGIKQLMRQNGIREDQWSMNACSGFGEVHAAAVGFWCQTGVWRTFNPHWSYVKAQEIDRSRGNVWPGDNGATIYAVTEGGKRFGLLPQDIENDGKKEFPFPRDNYRFKYPASAAQIAAERKTGYTVVLKSFRAILNFLQAGQGAVVIGGPWGGFTPDERGICRRYRAGTKGHARAYVDWVTIDGELMLDEANSHFLDYGDDGHAYHTEEFVNDQCADRRFVAVGISDITLSPGDKPKQRKIPRYVKLAGVSQTS